MRRWAFGIWNVQGDSASVRGHREHSEECGPWIEGW